MFATMHCLLLTLFTFFFFHHYLSSFIIIFLPFLLVGVGEMKDVGCCTNILNVVIVTDLRM